MYISFRALTHASCVRDSRCQIGTWQKRGAKSEFEISSNCRSDRVILDLVVWTVFCGAEACSRRVCALAPGHSVAGEKHGPRLFSRCGANKSSYLQRRSCLQRRDRTHTERERLISCHANEWRRPPARKRTCEQDWVLDAKQLGQRSLDLLRRRHDWLF